MGEEYLARTRIQRKTRAPVLHRQAAQQLPARRAHPPDAAATRASSMRAATRWAAASRTSSSTFARGQNFTYDLADLGAYYRSLRRADGALRRGAAGPRASRVLRGHGGQHRIRGAAPAGLLRPAVRARAACASTRTSAPCAPPVPSRCACRSTVRASSSGATSSRGSGRSRSALGPVLDAYPRRT